MFVKNTTNIKISVSQRISKMNCINYDHNHFFGLFKIQSGNIKFFLKSPKDYSRKIIHAQTEQEMSFKKTNGVGLKNEENITQARLSTCT